MAHIATDTATLRNISTRLGAGFDTMRAAAGRWLERFAMSHSRMCQIQALEAKTDAELSEMGLRRGDITRYVFRDRAYL